MKARPDLHGALFPLPTPFTRDGAVDYPVLGEMTKHYSNAGADGFFLFGSFGQGPAMTPDERKQGLEVVLQNLNRDIPIVVHVGTVDPYNTRDMAMHADALGVSAVAIVGPYYYTDRTPTELALHLKMLDEAISAPLFFYNNPAYQGYPLSAHDVKEMYEGTSGCIGVKIAKGTMKEAREYRAVFGPDVRLFVPVGNLIEGLSSKVLNGTVSPGMCTIPELGFGAVHAVERGDIPLAEKYVAAIEEYQAIHGPLIKEFGLRAPFGIGMRHLGFDMMYPRWPVPEIPADTAAELYAAIDRAREAAESLLPV